MDCPNCRKLMKERRKTYTPFSLGVDGDEYNYSESYSIFSCRQCNIVYNEKEEEWRIPHEYIATQKQINTLAFICNTLHLDLPAPTKKSAWQFIKDHLDYAKRVRDNDSEEWCQENSDWLPEYF